MKNLYVEVTFDFDDRFLQEKEIFLNFLSNENWVKLHSDRQWRIGFKKNIDSDEKLKIITNDLEVASKFSNIKYVDYAILLNDRIYIDKIV